MYILSHFLLSSSFLVMAKLFYLFRWQNCFICSDGKIVLSVLNPHVDSQNNDGAERRNLGSVGGGGCLVEWGFD